MEFIKIDWNHNHSDEPIEIYFELDSEGYELRKIEFYRDGSYGYAYDDIEYKNTRLAEIMFPGIEEYNRLNKESKDDWNENLFASSISEDSFNKIWMKYILPPKCC